MSGQVRYFEFTVPAGTVKATPVTLPLNLPIGATVDRIDWTVPPGPRGQMGWYLAMGGTQVVPFGTNNFLRADDRHGSWELAELPDEGEWQFVGYNTGNYPHTVYLEVLITPVQATAAPALTLIPGDLLKGVV